MARSFDAAQHEYLSGPAPLSAMPLAMACWFRASDTADYRVLMAVSDPQDHKSLELMAAGGASGDPLWAVTRTSPPISRYAVTTAGYSADAWHHAAAVFRAPDDVRVYLDGGHRGTIANAVAPSGLSTVYVAKVRYSNTDSFHYSGRIAEAALWDLAAWDLDAVDASIAALAAGFSPALFPRGLAAYWPLGGVFGPSDDDRSGDNDLTACNAPSWAEHPSVLYPSRPRAFVPTLEGPAPARPPYRAAAGRVAHAGAVAGGQFVTGPGAGQVFLSGPVAGSIHG